MNPDRPVQQSELERLVTAFRLLADPGRLRLVAALLEDRELPVRELSHAASLSETATSQQLRVLREAGVVRRRRLGRQILYRLNGGDARALARTGIRRAAFRSSYSTRKDAAVTYIIAEPCIDIKDKSCVDVCPVDCIHEFDRMLVIDPEECIDCFAPTEQLITSWGVRSFEELENQACRVLTDDGFEPAVVKRFRRKPLVDIELAPVFEERDHYGGTRLTTRSGSRFRRIVRATPTHSWALADGQRTDALAPGQFIPAMRAVPKRDSETYRLGVLHGLVFGDGSWNKQEIRSGEHLHYVQLCGEEVAKFRDFFDQVTFSPSLAIHPGYVGTGVVRSAANLKRLLPEDADIEYITGFVDGWLASDGDEVKAGLWQLRSIDHEALEWLEQAAPFAGYITVGSGEEASRETNFGVRSRPIRSLYLATRQALWRVMSVEPEDADDVETFCAVVPRKHEFTLAGGIYTRNCGACEPECPVEAIFPEDALPDKWEPFVKINYAYRDAPDGDTADVINRLVDDYALEHNVQNEPIN
jgi:DNA-binding transcriptional ArsR family regulator